MTPPAKRITLSKPFQVREDSALTLPGYVLDMLRWKKGDQLTYEVDPVSQQLTISLLRK